MTTTAEHRPRPIDLGKPRMRGWLHFYAFFIALICGIVLTSLAPLASVAIYSISVCGLFGISALYHRRVWSDRGYQVMRRLDHAMIFIFIAGTYTPFCALLLSPGKATLLLAIVWAGALGGAAMSLIWPHAPRWVSAPLYLALGWVAIAVLPDILRNGGVTALVLLLVGGAVYSLGAIFYALRKPNPWPTIFGHHEFFHACTLVAAICHQIAIYFAVFA
jgi:hemolysin III